MLEGHFTYLHCKADQGLESYETTLCEGKKGKKTVVLATSSETNVVPPCRKMAWECIGMCTGRFHSSLAQVGFLIICGFQNNLLSTLRKRGCCSWVHHKAENSPNWGKKTVELPAHQIGKAFLKHLPKQYVSGILSLINLQQINMNFSKKMEKETGCHWRRVSGGHKRIGEGPPFLFLKPSNTRVELKYWIPLMLKKGPLK